ncbi:MAG: hypothetical protein J6M10_10315 [Clostridia bacterium]|nr:hypothetical protein [Clostridia bacterium]
MAEISKGQVNLNSVLGAIGTAGAVMPGLFNGLFNGNANGNCGCNNGCNNGCNGGCSDNQYVTRYDAQKDARIAELETQVQLRDANTFTMGEMGKLRDYVDAKFAKVDAALCQQAVHNATNDAVVGCIQGQVAQLMAMTKLVIPNSSVCLGWGNVTITPAASTTTTG